MLICVIPRGGDSAPLPSTDVIGELDFVNGVYTLFGVALNAVDVVSHPERITASGLMDTDFPAYTDGKSTDIIGLFRDQLLAGNFTLVVEYEELVNTGMTMPLCIHTNLAGGVYQDFLQVQRYTVGSNHYGLIFDKSDNASNTERDIDTAATSPVISNLSTGIHKIAVTRTSATLRCAIDGGVVLTPTNGFDGTQNGFAADKVAVGGFSADFADNDCYLRKLTLYAPQDNSRLPTLSS